MHDLTCLLNDKIFSENNTILDNEFLYEVDLIPVTADILPRLLNDEFKYASAWVEACEFKGKKDTYCIIPSSNAIPVAILFGINENNINFQSFGVLPGIIKNCKFKIKILEELRDIFNTEALTTMSIFYGLGNYSFDKYKKISQSKKFSALVVPPECNFNDIERIIKAISHLRDLINAPACDMGPQDLYNFIRKFADKYSANLNEIVGDDLLIENYQSVYYVGNGSTRKPRLIELTWESKKPTKLSLAVVGKGVCFDSGGLNLKDHKGMLHMKKDMGGAAHAIALAMLIMDADLPIKLRVLIPAVDNMPSGSAYKQGDVIKTRSGISVEIGNTDAEGRVIMADPITAVCEEMPDLLIDFATLTGAARIALGTDIAALFANDQNIADRILKISAQIADPIWQMPLYERYEKLIEAKVGDVANSAESSYGGAITAALFLQKFVKQNVKWMHFDINAWSLSSMHKYDGGDANALRAVYEYLKKRLEAR